MQPTMPDDMESVQERAWAFGLQAFDWAAYGPALLAFVKEHQAIHALVNFEKNLENPKGFPSGIYVACPKDRGADGRIETEALTFPLTRPDLNSDPDAKRITIGMIAKQLGIALETIDAQPCFSVGSFQDKLRDPQYFAQLEQRRLRAELDARKAQTPGGASEMDASPAPARRSRMRL